MEVFWWVKASLVAYMCIKGISNLFRAGKNFVSTFFSFLSESFN